MVTVPREPHFAAHSTELDQLLEVAQEAQLYVNYSVVQLVPECAADLDLVDALAVSEPIQS